MHLENSHIKEKNEKPPSKLRLWIARIIALLGYLWAIVILVLCIPLLVINMTAAEILISKLPQQEESDHVGAWTPYASTGLVLIAALVARYHRAYTDLARRMAAKTSWYSFHTLREVLRRSTRSRDREKSLVPPGSLANDATLGVQEASKRVRTDFISGPFHFVKINVVTVIVGVIQIIPNEWRLLKEFWSDDTENIILHSGKRHLEFLIHGKAPQPNSRFQQQQFTLPIFSSSTENTASITNSPGNTSQPISPSTDNVSPTATQSHNQRREAQQVRMSTHPTELEAALNNARTGRERPSQGYSPDLSPTTRSSPLGIMVDSTTNSPFQGRKSSEQSKTRPMSLQQRSDSGSPAQFAHDWPMPSPRSSGRSRGSSSTNLRSSPIFPVTKPLPNQPYQGGEHDYTESARPRPTHSATWQVSTSISSRGHPLRGQQRVPMNEAILRRPVGSLQSTEGIAELPSESTAHPTKLNDMCRLKVMDGREMLGKMPTGEILEARSHIAKIDAYFISIKIFKTTRKSPAFPLCVCQESSFS